MHNLKLAKARQGYLLLLYVTLYTEISKAQADDCGDINDITSDLYKGNITPVYNVWTIKDGLKGRVTDGDKQTCLIFMRQPVSKPEISFVLHQPISSHYIFIYYRTDSAKNLQFTVGKETPCKLCKQITTNGQLYQTSYIICNYNYTASEINFRWTWGKLDEREKAFTTEICEISFYEVKPKCGILPEIANGAYRISSRNMNQYYNFKIGTNATLVCSEGFQPSNESTTRVVLHIQCTESGIWTTSDATCSKKSKYGILPQIVYGEYIISSGSLSQYDNFKVGTNATLVCSEGFQPSEESTTLHIQCTEIGNWTSTNATCSKLPDGRESSWQTFNLEVSIIIMVATIKVTIGIVLIIKKIVSYKKKSQNRITCTDNGPMIDPIQDPIYENVPSSAQAQLSLLDPYLNPTSCDSIYLRPIMRTQNGVLSMDSCEDISLPIYSEVGPIVERSACNKLVCNDQYAYVG